jgi:hypothetical protein
MANDGCCASESPLACDLGAISASDRPRYNELRRAVAASVVGKRELPDGLAIQIDTARIALPQLAEWISFERKCCPFFEFRIDLAAESGPVWLSLTGRTGVKEFIAQAFAG